MQCKISSGHLGKVGGKKGKINFKCFFFLTNMPIILSLKNIGNIKTINLIFYLFSLSLFENQCAF